MCVANRRHPSVLVAVTTLI